MVLGSSSFAGVAFGEAFAAGDEFSRVKDHSARLALAGEISELVVQLRTLADGMIHEVGEPGD